MKRMSLRQFGRIVARVLQTLPDSFLPYLDNLVVDVEYEPDFDTLRRAGFSDQEIAAGETLYGLFDPLDLAGLDSEEILDTGEAPHRLIIFQRPLQEDFPDRRTLLLEIRKTVIHELAHHFGYSERDLDAFEAKSDPFQDGLTDILDQGEP